MSRVAAAYIHGRVFTVDERKPWAEAFIVSASGRFEAVGTNETILNSAKEQSLPTYDLKNIFIMPGIHDAHTHLLLASMQKLNEIDIGSDSTATTTGANIKKGQSACACADAHVRGDWLIANFYAGNNFPDGKIDRTYLDDAFPDRPLLVRDISCHNVVMNSAGLERAGYDIEVNKEDPPGGKYVRRPDGSMTGKLVEAATTQVWSRLPQPPISYVKEAILYGIEMSHRFGITSVQEASANTIYLHALRELEQENRLQMEVFPHIVHAPETFAAESQETLHHLIENADTFCSEHVDPRFVKFWMDGAPIPPHFTHCELGPDGSPDENKLLLSFDSLLSALIQHDVRGMTCKIHCAGEGSVRRALDVLEIVRQSNLAGPQHELAHCNAIYKGERQTIDIPRMAKLQITAEMSPAIFHDTSLTVNFPHIFQWPFKELQDAGVHVTVGSDWILPPTPDIFPALSAIVERFVSEPGKAAEEAGGEKICRIITLAGAEAVGQSRELGSIEVGKKANFIAVDRDLSRGEFAGAKVLKTWFEGEVVWEDGGNVDPNIPRLASL
ncbi:amidohydrolase 3 [Aspergillus caelatus]|uniref:Amidohydrolase 3 n=1 Tax=Aspergillus caelatus TaxID=61420 RepID=A0A5N7A4Z3_9EURO|nr:amidohydrolase 3 [Aspergillus caelatus]KAE8364931.1 amidohydrolase 3 [Aspergillus caelatus]